MRLIRKVDKRDFANHSAYFAMAVAVARFSTEQGQVVGITSAALVGGENLNFAVPINDLKPMLAARLSRASVFSR